MGKLKSMKFIRSFITGIGCVGFLLSVCSCYYKNEEDLYSGSNLQDCDTAHYTFSGQVLPLMQQNCISCHNNTTLSGSISLDNYSSVKQVVDPGRFWGAINHDQGFVPMPLDAGKLSDCNLIIIKKWLDHGALNN
jgi:hypothetical protein